MSMTFEIALLSVTAIAAFTDSRTGRIPNALTLSAIVLAIALHIVLGGLAAGALSAVGLGVCMLPPLVVFRLGGMGGGDVKLFAAIGAIVGATRGLEVQTFAYAATAVVALVTLFRRGDLRRLTRRLGGILLRRRPLDDVLPVATFRLGVPIFVASVVSTIGELG